ncbi:SNF2 family N-terminal domain-containing protein [Xylaria sp. FL0064]|nr:SNF2 family N-terminal domain-containing protein [Xylaria sp. FL0064]
MATGKRRRGEPGPSTEANPNKKRKTGRKRRDTQRKAEIMNQLGGLCDWRARWTDEPSEYTSQQYEREKHEHEVAIEILRSKFTAEGHEDSGNELGRIKGMSSTIRDYQAVGAAFMVRLERSRKDCRGGIIADDMGIGKTVQGIACMMVNFPSKKAMSEHRGTTLIIVPNQGLVKQWAEELSRHAEISSRQVCKYAGGGKIGGLGIKGYPFVLATYGQVEREFRFFHNKNEEDEAPLFEIEFFRIILDEADSIKNYHGKTCGELRAKLKWVLSGTPLRNSVDECLPYFRFLGINVEEDLDSFINKWGKPESSETYDRTMQILAKIMLRREAGQMFLGREMCALPKSHYEDRLLRITEEEKAVSRYLQQAMCRAEEDAKPRWTPVESNGYEDKEVNRSSPKSNFRVRTTRLRQAAAHPFLLENSIRGFMNRHELESLIADLKQIELSKKKNKSRDLCSDEPQCSQSGGLTIYEIALDIKFHVGDFLSSWNSEENKGCLECFTMVELQPLECGHFICRSCYKEHTGDIAITRESQFTCVQCHRIAAVLPNIKEEPGNELLSRKGPVKPGNGDLRTSGADLNGMQLRMSHSGSRWLKKCDEVGLVTASTKTKAAIEIVVSWQEEAPDDRIVIFTEWIVTSKVLGRLLNKFDIIFVYYNRDIYYGPRIYLL